ncbi:MAG: NUDIX hydrolase [Deltaproteobacteria bacterium]|nr:MAG: NUDIX hydrolase [Deltaproteobacteria bacterium]
MQRHYPKRPIVGVGAVIFKDNQVVLARRGRAPAYGAWSLPGGGVELGETLEAAIIREVFEEIGLGIEVEKLVAVLDRIFLDEAGQVKYHYVLIDFLCQITSGKMRASSDALSCALVPMEATAPYRLSRETLEVIRRAYQHLYGGSPPIYMVTRVTEALPSG